MRTMTAAEYRREAGIASAAECFWSRVELSTPMPPSVNNAYATVHGRRVLTREGREFKASATALVRKAAAGQCAPVWLTMTIRLYLPLCYKNGKVRRVDVSNRVKLLEDAVCEGLGVDDCRVRRLVVEKFDAHDERADVIVEAWRADKGLA